MVLATHSHTPVALPATMDSASGRGWYTQVEERSQAGCMRTLITVDVRTRQQWRAWLTKNHASSPGVWLIRHKQQSGLKSMPHEDVVCEALCFGWIDSLIKRLDDARYTIKVTPRKPKSKWSEMNRRRWNVLKAAGQLEASGLAASPTGNNHAPHPPIPELLSYVAKAFRTNPRAWRYFRGLAPTYRRDFVKWIHTAKRPETRAKRIRESIRLLSSGSKLGLK